jgi:hypothetical protein
MALETGSPGVALHHVRINVVNGVVARTAAEIIFVSGIQVVPGSTTQTRR